MALLTYRFDIVMRQISYANVDRSGDNVPQSAKLKSESCKRIKFETNVMGKSFCTSFDTDTCSSLNDLVKSYPTMGNLMRLLRDTFGVSSKVSAFLYYEDEEGDLIRLSSDKEWREVAKNYLKQALDKGLEVVQMRMLFSPKHHYKVADHGKVDFSEYNFENCLMKMVRNEAPDSLSPDVPQVEAEVKDAPNNSSEQRKEDSSSQSCSLNNAATANSVVVQKTETVDITPQKDFHARIEEFLAETNSRKENISATSVASNWELSLGETQKREIIEFVKKEIPEIVDEYLKSKVIEAGQTSAHENEVSVDTEEATRLPETKTETTNLVDVAEITDESISVVLASNIQPVIYTHPSEEARVQCSTDCEQPHRLEFLFHENESTKFTVLGGSLFHKLWCVLNSGVTTWCKDSYVIETSSNGFEVASSHVDILQPNEVGTVFACVKVPEKSGSYKLEFKVLSDCGKDFVVNSSLGCTVSVIDNPIEYSRCLSEAGSCRGEVGSDAEVNSLSIEDEKIENVEFEDCDQDNANTESMCEDETIMDEDNFGSTDDEMEMIEDFTFIPLPDCFDLNRVPAIQSTSVYSRRSSGSMSESKRGTDVAQKDESQTDEDTTDGRDRPISEISEELVDPFSEIEDIEISSTNQDCSVNDEPQETTLNSCETKAEEVATLGTGWEKRPFSRPIYDECFSEIDSSCEKGESEVSGASPTRYITPSAEKEILQKLNGMGFCDKKKNREILVKHDFDFDKALDELIADFEPLRRE